MDCHSFLLAIVPGFRYDEKKGVDSDGFALKSDAAAPDGWQEDAARILSGKTELTLHRIEE